MKEIVFIISSIGFLVCAYYIEYYFFKKSIYAIKEVKKAYSDLKEAQKNLKI